eukprot:5077367-Prymnesium_polylepis.1
MRTTFLGNAAARDDISEVTNFEWCLGSVEGTCDLSIMAPTVAPSSEGTLVNNSDGSVDLKPELGPDNSTLVQFRGAVALEPDDNIFVGVRAGNELGLWSGWLWSAATRIGKAE